MMEYRVIRDFADARDKGHIYHAGDIFPRAGVVSESRIAELSGYGNRIGAPLIEAAVPAAPDVPDDPISLTLSTNSAETAMPDVPEAAAESAESAKGKPKEQEKPKTRKTAKSKAEAQKN